MRGPPKTKTPSTKSFLGTVDGEATNWQEPVRAHIIRPPNARGNYSSFLPHHPAPADRHSNRPLAWRRARRQVIPGAPTPNLIGGGSD